MGYTIYSYGDLDNLAVLFNFLAAMVGHDSYLAAIALSLILGFFGALLSMAFLKHLHGVHWLLAVAIINGVLLVPKSTVQIVDKLSGQAPVVVDNVPWGVASLAAVVTSAGSGLTELFETGFQVLPSALGVNSTVALPADLTYEKNGLMYGATLIKEVGKARFADPLFETDLVNFIANCTLYDLSQGKIDTNEFINSRNIWRLMSSTNMARFSTYHDPATGTFDSYTCPDVYGRLNARMDGEVTNQLTNLAHANSPLLRARRGQVVDSADVAAAVAEFNPKLEAAYMRSLLGETATTAADIVRQNGVINAVNGAGALFSQRTNDPSALMLGMAQAQTAAAMNAQKIVSGEMAKAALPLLQNGITFIVYGTYPLVILVALILGGMGAVQLLKKYALALVWLAMWPPLYAMVNYYHSTAAAKAAASAGFVNGVQGLTLASASAVYSTTVSELANTSWLMVSVPLIASAIVFGMDRLANVGMGFMTAMGSSASFGSRQAGDYTGSMSLNQLQLAPNRSDAFMSTFTNTLGKTTEDHLNGYMRYEANTGRSAIGVTSSTEMGRAASQASSVAERAAQEHTKSAERSYESALQKIIGESQEKRVDKVFSKGAAHRDGAGHNTQASRIREVVDSFKEQTGIKDSAAAARALSLNLELGAPGAAKALMRLAGVDANLKLQLQGKSEQQIEQSMTKAHDSLRKMGIQDAHSLVDEYVKSEDFQKRVSAGDGTSTQIAASHRDAVGYSKAARVQYAKTQEFQRKSEIFERAADSGKFDWAAEINNYVKTNGTAAWVPQEYRIASTQDLGRLAEKKMAEYWLPKFMEDAVIGVNGRGAPVLMAPTLASSMPPTKHATGLEAAYAAGTPTVSSVPMSPDARREISEHFLGISGTIRQAPAGWFNPEAQGKKLEGRAGKAKAATQVETEVADKAEIILGDQAAASMEQKGKNLSLGVKIADLGLAGKVRDATNDGKK